MTRFCYRLIILVSCFILTSQRVWGQVGEARHELALGINAGTTLTRITFSPSIKQQQFIAPTLGLTLRYTSEKYFKTYCALQVELNYAQLGWKELILDAQSLPLPDRYTHRFHYLQLPLLTRLSWGREERGLMFYFIVGPQLGYVLGESVTQSDEWTLAPSGHPLRPNNVYQQYTEKVKNKLDYGITGGLGIALNSRAGHWMLEGRYYYGLKDLYGNSKKDFFERSAHATFTIKGTYLLPLGRRKGQ